MDGSNKMSSAVECSECVDMDGRVGVEDMIIGSSETGNSAGGDDG